MPVGCLGVFQCYSPITDQVRNGSLVVFHAVCEVCFSAAVFKKEF